MGQRLNIEVMSHGKVIANSYYHWSAYSNSAVALAREALSAALEVDDRKQPLTTAIICLEYTGAGFNEEAIAEAKESLGLDLSRFARCRNRNEGILEVSEKGMEDNRRWEEGRVTIDLDSQTVDFSICCSYHPDDFLRYRIDDVGDEEDEAESMLDAMPRYYFNFSALTIDDLTELQCVIEDHPAGILNYGEVVEWVL